MLCHFEAHGKVELTSHTELATEITGLETTSRYTEEIEVDACGVNPMDIRNACLEKGLKKPSSAAADIDDGPNWRQLEQERNENGG